MPAFPRLKFYIAQLFFVCVLQKNIENPAGLCKLQYIVFLVGEYAFNKFPVRLHYHRLYMVWAVFVLPPKADAGAVTPRRFFGRVYFEARQEKQE